MANADKVADEELTRDLAKRTEDAMQAPAPIFNTHSQALAGRLVAEERALIEQCADIDAKIAALQAERTDVLLAQSGITAALGAMERNR
jgi:ABC-type amino acid transport substrate-binding protein